MGKAQGGGSGWVLLTWSPRDGKLINQWAMDHTTTLAGGCPILALDMYEHSYHMDYGARAAPMSMRSWRRLIGRTSHVPTANCVREPHTPHHITSPALRSTLVLATVGWFSASAALARAEVTNPAALARTL